MTQISTLTACLMGIVTCTVAEEIKTANVMEDKAIYCGECEKFLYEDTDGFGVGGKTNKKCYCGDKCYLTYKNYDTLRLRSLLQRAMFKAVRLSEVYDI